MLRPADRLALARDVLPRGGVGAELGVRHGDYAAVLLEQAQPRKLYLVDAFVIDLWGTTGEQALERTTQRFAGQIAEGQVIVEREDSVAWLKRQPQSSLDWLYIDTNHEHHHTMMELCAAFRAVRAGGYIAGHDYCPVNPGVVLAVDWFCWSHAQQLAVVTDEPEVPWEATLPWHPKTTHLNSFAIQVAK